MRFEFANTHAYRGCPVRIDRRGFADAGGGSAEIEFSDGQVVAGSWSAVDGGVSLTVPPYETARGTRIPSKRWRLRELPDGTWKVAARLPGEPSH